MMPDCLLVMVAEVLVDWIKHAFITRFNELPVDVYRDYTLSLAYDLAQTRQKNAFTDHSDLVARRMGFIPLPLGVVMVRVLASSVKVQGPIAYFLSALSYLTVSVIRILNNIIILALACYLIDYHQKERDEQEKPSPGIKDSATSPTRPVNSAVKTAQHKSVILTEPRIEPTLGTAPIFSNSTVNMNDVCLNEELLRVDGEMGSMRNILEDEEVASPLADSKKKSESEPSIPSVIDPPPV